MTPLKHALAHSSLITGLMMVMSPLPKAVSSLSSLANPNLKTKEKEIEREEALAPSPLACQLLHCFNL